MKSVLIGEWIKVRVIHGVVPSHDGKYRATCRRMYYVKEITYYITLELYDIGEEAYYRGRTCYITHELNDIGEEAYYTRGRTYYITHELYDIGEEA